MAVNMLYASMSILARNKDEPESIHAFRLGFIIQQIMFTSPSLLCS